jgi:plastocyanin
MFVAAVGDVAVGDLRIRGSNAGMPGMSRMPSMPNMPAGTPAPTTGSAAPVAGDAVSIDNFASVPATLTVAASSTVTWTNRDEEPHTVVANDGSFHSPGMGSQATFSYKFATAGTRSCTPPWS